YQRHWAKNHRKNHREIPK
ncbi:exodeoxyribonuclease V, Alpha domain protein, partial [Chlamydia psittaci C1/97]